MNGYTERELKKMVEDAAIYGIGVTRIDPHDIYVKPSRQRNSDGMYLLGLMVSAALGVLVGILLEAAWRIL